MKKILFFFLFILPVVVSFNCSKKSESDVSFIIVESEDGSLYSTSSGKKSILSKGSGLKNGSRILASERFSAKLTSADGTIFVLAPKSIATVGYEYTKDSSGVNYSIYLESGKLAVLTTDNENNIVSITNSNGSIVTKKASFISEDYGDRGYIVMLFTGNISLYANGEAGDNLTISNCGKVLVTKNGRISDIVTLSRKDINRVKSWLGADLSLRFSEISPCLNYALKDNNPPIWKSSPIKEIIKGKLLVQPLLAEDPEGSEVNYTLIKGPNGAKIDPVNRVLKYKAVKQGNYDIVISATDTSGNSADLSYVLTVPGKLSASLVVPEFVIVGDTLVANASASANPSGKHENLLYKIYVNVKKNPAKFTKQSIGKFIMTKPGNYSIVAEIKEKNRKKIDRVAKEVVVINRPKVKLEVSSTSAPLNHPFEFKAVSLDDGLSYRWDIGSDGTWDIPTNGEWGDFSSIKRKWSDAGKYKVAVEIKNGYGLTAKAETYVEVFGSFKIDSIVAPDTVNVNSVFSAKAIVPKSQFRIVEYAWDFAGVGMFDQKTTVDNIKLSYKKAGIYTLVCTATDEKGQSASASKDIIATNDSTITDAGGPYKTFVNVPVTLRGFAKDADNKIVAYFWDFDNDGTFDKQSKNSSKCQHIYNKNGKYKIKFAVKTDDGRISSDFAEVTVINRSPKVTAMDDIVSKKGKKIILRAIAADPDRNIKEYEWDFDGDGKFDWSSSDSATVKHQFEVFSKPVIKVTDAGGKSAFDTLRVVICPKGMVTVKSEKFCVDEYEWPNKKGEFPTANISYSDALKKCNSVGKRLCSAKEYTAACLGEKFSYKFPYGKRYVPDNCNTFGNRHIKNSKSKSGEYPLCGGALNVYDMSGNLAEWTSDGSNDSKYTMGGWWQSSNNHAECNSKVLQKKNSTKHNIGFRCCK